MQSILDELAFGEPSGRNQEPIAELVDVATFNIAKLADQQKPAMLGGSGDNR